MRVLGGLREIVVTADLLVTYFFPGEHVSLAGYVDNVEDAAVIGFAQPPPRAPTLVVGNLRPPRTYGIRIGAKF